MPLPLSGLICSPRRTPPHVLALAFLHFLGPDGFPRMLGNHEWSHPLPAGRSYPHACFLPGDDIELALKDTYNGCSSLV